METIVSNIAGQIVQWFQSSQGQETVKEALRHGVLHLLQHH